VAALLLQGCSFLSIDPVINDKHRVTAIANSERTVVFLEPLSWANGPDHRATRVLFIPVGTYSLEAQNQDFLYFRGPNPLTMSIVDRGVPTDARQFVGGVAFAKAVLAQIPAEAYVSKSETEKIHVMRLGWDFSRLRGKVWKRDE